MTRRVKAILKARQETNKTKPFNATIDQADKAWAWVRKEMNLEKDVQYVLHSLRHTCATRLVNKGVDLYVVKEFLGHSSIQVTDGMPTWHLASWHMQALYLRISIVRIDARLTQICKYNVTEL